MTGRFNTVSSYRLSLVLILCQISPVHTVQIDLFETKFKYYPYHMNLDLSSGLFPSGLPTKTLEEPHLRRPGNVAQLRAHIVKLCRALSEDLCRKVVTNARVRLQEAVR